MLLDFEFCIVLNPPFPNGIDDIELPPNAEAQRRAAIDGIVARLDACLHRPCGVEKVSGLWHDDKKMWCYSYYLPPIMGDEPPEVMRCFRPVREGDAGWGSPFSDEQWIPIRYAGINVFRTITYLGLPQELG